MSSYATASGTTNGSGQSLNFAHTLSVTPDFVLVSVNSTSPDNVAATNITATTVDIYTTAANQPFILLAVKI